MWHSAWDRWCDWAVGEYSLLPHWTGKLVCMGGVPCCGRCIVLCRVKEEQQTHFMNYWKNMWAARHSVSQPVIDGGLLIISVLDTLENTSLTYSDYISWPLPAWKQGRGLVTSAVDKVLLWENTHLFCLFEAPNWTFAYLPEQYVNSTCATFSHFTPEGFRAQSQS